MKNALGRLVSGISGAFEVNEAFLSGALDVIVIRHKDGKLMASPFHVRFGKLKLLRTREKIVKIFVNGSLSNICMKLGKAGEAYFIEESPDEDTSNPSSPHDSPELSPGKSPSPIEMSSEEDVLPKEPDYRWYAPWRGKAEKKIPGKKGIFGRFFNIFDRGSEGRVEEGVALSLCLDQITNEESLERVFNDNLVTFELFSSEPWKILNHPNLLLRINGKYLNWEKAAPLLVSMLAFKNIEGSTSETFRLEEKSLKEEKSFKKENSLKEESKEEEKLAKEAKSSPVTQKLKFHSRRSIVLKSEQLLKLGLREGMNEVVYKVFNRSTQKSSSGTGRLVSSYQTSTGLSQNQTSSGSSFRWSARTGLIQELRSFTQIS
jgi:phosphatidate phosphatase LPIN